jgi:hypothetical protein
VLLTATFSRCSRHPAPQLCSLRRSGLAEKNKKTNARDEQKEVPRVTKILVPLELELNAISIWRRSEIVWSNGDHFITHIAMLSELRRQAALLFVISHRDPLNKVGFAAVKKRVLKLLKGLGLGEGAQSVRETCEAYLGREDWMYRRTERKGNPGVCAVFSSMLEKQLSSFSLSAS